MQNSKALFFQAGLFGLVGLLTLLVDVITTSALYNVFGFTAFLASCIGFLSGFIVSFPLNRKKVFRHTDNDRFSMNKQLMLFGSLSVLNLFLSSIIVQLLVDTEVLSIEYSKVAVTGAIAVWNFLLFKFFIFSKK